MTLTRGQRLLRLREQKGVEQKVAAAAAGISATWLCLLERDKKGSNLDHLRVTLERAANYYGVLPEYLTAETPQDYMQAYVNKASANADLQTVGRRLRFVLTELENRWGEEYSLENVAEMLGTSVSTLKQYMADRLLSFADETFVTRLQEVVGVPLEFFQLAPIGVDQDEQAIRRIVRTAVENGIPPQELEYLIQAWGIARNTNRPPTG